MLIGKRVKDLRVQAQISQQELGNIIGVTKVSICGYESGTRVPSLDTLVKLSDALNTSTDFLLGREIPVVNEETRNYVGAISEYDVEFIQELKHNPMLYNRVIKDIKKTVNKMSKKI